MAGKHRSGRTVQITLTQHQAEFLKELLKDIDEFKEEDEDLLLHYYCPIYVQRRDIRSARAIIKKLDAYV